jgi:hypothetical protein
MIFNRKTNVIAIVDGNPRIDEDLLEKLNVNNDEHEHLDFSESSDQQVGEYQLEKGSIIWKIQTKDFKQNIEKSEKNIIKWQIERLLIDFVRRVNKVGIG